MVKNLIQQISFVLLTMTSVSVSAASIHGYVTATDRKPPGQEYKIYVGKLGQLQIRDAYDQSLMENIFYKANRLGPPFVTIKNEKNQKVPKWISGEFILGINDDGRIEMSDAETGRLILELNPPKARVLSGVQVVPLNPNLIGIAIYTVDSNKPSVYYLSVDQLEFESGQPIRLIVTPGNCSEFLAPAE